jgi:hypothetical protein
MNANRKLRSVDEKLFRLQNSPFMGFMGVLWAFISPKRTGKIFRKICMFIATRNAIYLPNYTDIFHVKIRTFK